MQVLPIDLTSIIAVVMGISVVLVPVIGVTARFALKPTVEALSRFFDAKGREEAFQIMERRMALMEQQIENMDSTVRRLREVTEFHERLASGEEPDESARGALPRSSGAGEPLGGTDASTTGEAPVDPLSSGGE